VRRWLVFVVPFVVVFGTGLLVIGWNKGWFGASRGVPVPITFDDLDHPPTFVKIRGMAHYTAVVKQDVPGNLFRKPQVYYLFGLFPPYDTDDRKIRLLVRTTRAPERLVSYELMTLEGRLERPTLSKVPFDTEIILGKYSDYFFADDVWLIEPWSIQSGLGGGTGDAAAPAAASQPAPPPGGSR